MCLYGSSGMPFQNHRNAVFNFIDPLGIIPGDVRKKKAPDAPAVTTQSPDQKLNASAQTDPATQAMYPTQNVGPDEELRKKLLASTEQSQAAKAGKIV